MFFIAIFSGFCAGSLNSTLVVDVISIPPIAFTHINEKLFSAA
jgi:hypothetical protein